MRIPPRSPGVYVGEVPAGDQPITGESTSVTAFLGPALQGPVDEPVPISGLADFTRVFGPLWHGSGLGYAIRDFYLNGGGAAHVVRVAGGADTTAADGEPPGLEQYVPTGTALTGLRALDAVDHLNLLVLPPVTPGGDLPVAVWREALAYAVARRAFLIVDPPRGTALEDVPGWVTTTAGLGGVDGRNAAVYAPRVRMADPLRGGAVGDFAPSGAIAGIYARTDADRGVWKAPAGVGTGMAGVLGTSAPVTEPQVALVNPAAVNTIRTFPGTGTVLWGARTLRGTQQPADAYRYVSVRRLALFLEESIVRSTRWVASEPNGEPLRERLRLVVGDFLQGLFRRGAFQGASPDHAYGVRCDAETVAGAGTGADADPGFLTLQVSFAPIKPAEFVVITLRLPTAGSTVRVAPLERPDTLDRGERLIRRARPRYRPRSPRTR